MVKGVKKTNVDMNSGCFLYNVSRFEGGSITDLSAMESE